MYILRFLLLAACALPVSLLSSPAVAADIYRWVDENGRTHVSDTVPARYRSAATRVDTSAADVSEQDRNAARQRAERERQQLEAQRAAARKAQADAAPAAPQGAGELAAPQEPQEDACAAKWRAYRESQECFAPYINSAQNHGHAHLNEEAFKYCKPVTDPSAECGAAPDMR